MKAAEIFVGVARCNKTTVVSDEQMQCTPPAQQPQPSESSHSHKLPRVIVRIVSRVS